MIELPKKIEGYQVDGVEIIELEKNTRELFESDKIIGITSPIDMKELIYYAARNKLWNIIRKDSTNYIDELLLSLTILDPSIEIKDTGLVDVMLQRPFSSYQFSTSMNVPFTQKKDWKKILSSYELFVMGLPQNVIVKNIIPLIMDEYFTNAIFNAPIGVIDGWEEHRANSKEQEFKFNKDGNMRIAYSNEYILIECMDPFGTFNPSDMLKCIKKTYDVGIRNAIRDDKNKGAGIGLRMVWEKSMSMGVVVKKGEFCSFFSIIPYRIPLKTLEDHPKNFHIIQK